MKCPICHGELDPVYGDTYPGDTRRFKQNEPLPKPIGYNCPTQTDLPAGAQTPHYTIRGLNEIVTIFPYRVSTWHIISPPHQILISP